MRRIHDDATRRDFLRAGGGLLGAAGLAALAADPVEAAFPQQTPNEQIRIGHIGVGNQGRGNLRKHIRNTVAVCDVDSTRLGEAREMVRRETNRDCAAYADFRRLLDDRNVDAVVVTTPDHWHALPVIMACQAGKDVYCEKPLSLTVAEGRRMVEAARRHNRVVQTGSQQRSDDRFRLACELVRNGKLGRIRTVRVGIPGVNFQGPPVPDSDPPAELDYNFWLGPAPEKPYNAKHVHYNFRFFWDYSGGQITNWGAHHLDIAQWALGMDDSGPGRIEGTARFHPQMWYEVPQSFEVVYSYPDDVRLICGMGQRAGVTFEGSEGTLFVTRGRIEANPREILDSEFGEGDVRLYVSADHHRNWLDCIRTRRTPIADVEIGHRSATVCHLGNIAIRSGRPLRWDPAREQVIDDAEQSAMLARPYRAPWRLPVIER